MFQKRRKRKRVASNATLLPPTEPHTDETETPPEPAPQFLALKTNPKKP